MRYFLLYNFNFKGFFFAKNNNFSIKFGYPGLLLFKGPASLLSRFGLKHSKVYWHFLGKFGSSSSFLYIKSVFDSNYKIVLPSYFLKKFGVFRKYHELVWSSLFSLFYYSDWFLFEGMVRKLFNDTRLDRHGRLFKFIKFFFKKFPYYSTNVYYVCLKIKGKMSRKGTARKKTIYLKRYFFQNLVVYPKFSLKKYYFLIVSKTGCTCFLGFVKQIH